MLRQTKVDGLEEVLREWHTHRISLGRRSHKGRPAKEDWTAPSGTFD